MSDSSDGSELGGDSPSRYARWRASRDFVQVITGLDDVHFACDFSLAIEKTRMKIMSFTLTIRIAENAMIMLHSKKHFDNISKKWEEYYACYRRVDP